MGKILEGVVCKILEQRGPEQGGACLVPFNIIKGFIGRISFPRLYLFSHSFRRASNAFFPGRIDFSQFFPYFSPGTAVFSPRLSQAQITTSPVEYTHHIACSVRACAFASMCQVCVCSLFKYIARAVTWRLCLLRRQTTLEPSLAARGRGRPRCIQR